MVHLEPHQKLRRLRRPMGDQTESTSDWDSLVRGEWFLRIDRHSSNIDTTTMRKARRDARTKHRNQDV